MRAADRLIAPTEFVRRWYVAHGAPPDRLLVIPPGLEYPSLIRRQYEKPSDIVRFAYVGGISWQKGIHVLVEAFDQVDGPAELWIAGDESFDPAYSSRLHAQASPNVRFLGKLTRQKVWDTLAQVHVVVVPSIWYETFSFLISEAFAAGVPVVASRLGPLADRVRDGIDGLLVPPGDGTAWRAALQRLVDEPDLLNRLRANVQSPMTLEEHVSQVESLYAQVIQGREANLAKPD
jgi:glycosyltransferase involved in cell wall biosynthesis